MGTSSALKSVEYAKVAAILAGTTGGVGTFPDASKRKLRGQTAMFVHEVTAYDAGSEITFMLLPKGAIVLAFVVAAEAQGAAVTIDFEIGGVAACTSEAWTDMTSDMTLVIPSLQVFHRTPLTADSLLVGITAAQPTGIGDEMQVTCLYLLED
jgi:hypothetical protein